MEKLRTNIKAKWVSKAGIGIEDVFKRSPAAKETIRAGLPVATWRNLNKQYLHNIEHYKGKRTKFWPGAAMGFCIGYCFYLGHMYQIFH